MKIQIEIDESELKELIIQTIAERAAQSMWGNDYESDIKEKRKAILDKINWKNASNQLSEVVIQKFFSKLIDGDRR
jgi:hypothetical protein